MTGAASHDTARTSAWSVLAQRWAARALEDGQAGLASDGGWSDFGVARLAARVDEFFDQSPVARATKGGWFAWLAQDEDTWTHVELEPDGSWQVQVSADSQAKAQAALDTMRVFFPAGTMSEDGKIAVRFWANGPMGPSAYHRRLDASSLDDVLPNYPKAVSKQLAHLGEMTAPEAGGRLMLWHGPPGTGKTHAIRALSAAWSSWCDVDYIVDADEFFAHASYMVSALIANEDAGSDRWRVVVVEDAGRYLLENAQEKIGEGLGRLLNLSDGLVGQGLRLLVLMTTNEPADSLHPAVTRPGRCLANMKFGEFPPAQAKAWLKAHGVKADVDKPMTLAQLYAEASDSQTLVASAHGTALTDSVATADDVLRMKAAAMRGR